MIFKIMIFKIFEIMIFKIFKIYIIYNIALFCFSIKDIRAYKDRFGDFKFCGSVVTF
jgi:hypothetical protein